MRKYYSILFFILIVGNIVAQKNGEKTITKDGKKFYRHIVTKGETIYGLSKDYNIPPRDIVMENPKAMEGISAGDTLQIPFPVAETKPVIDTAADKASGKYIYHKVVAKETLYSLGKQYKVSINTLDSLNPELKTKGLQTGQNLRIPAQPQTVSTPTQPAPPVIKPTTPAPSASHTADSIKQRQAFQNLVSHQHIDTVKKVTNKPIVTPPMPTPVPVSVSPVDKSKLMSRYNVAIIMPFVSENADTLRMNHLLDGSQQLPLYTQISTEFYQGAMVALDSLAKQGVRVNLHLYNISSSSDTSSNKLDSILKSPAFATTNLIIGPPWTGQFKQVARYAAQHSIAIVSPIVSDNSVLLNNPYASEATPNSMTEIEKMADYVAKHYSKCNVLLLRHRDAIDETYYNNFMKRYNTDVSVNSTKDSITVVDYSENLAELGKKVNEYKNNIIIAPYQQASFVAKLVNKLAYSRYADNDSIVLFGMHSWLNNDNLDVANLDTLDFHFASNDYVNYSDSCTKGFIQTYRSNYYTEPSSFAMQGFDITFYYVRLLGKYGTALQDHLSDAIYNGVHTSFDMHRINDTGGYDNKAVNIIEYRNYTIVKANL